MLAILLLRMPPGSKALFLRLAVETLIMRSIPTFLSATLLTLAFSGVAVAADPPPPQTVSPADTGAGRTNPEVELLDTFNPSTPGVKPAIFSDATQAELSAAGVVIGQSGAGMPARGVPGSMDAVGTAQTKGQAIRPDQLTDINNEIQKLATLLDAGLIGNFAGGSVDVKAQVIKEGIQKSAELGTRVNSAMAPTVDSFGRLTTPNNPAPVSPLAEVEILGGWGFRGSAERRPTEPEKYPEYTPVSEMQRFGDAETKKVNKFLDKAENFMSKKMGLGGCSAFDFASEFVALFNRETLKNLVKNLKEGVIASAPMAIIQALSPELANLIQHLKAMASIALQIANGNCETAKAALQPALEKMFNGPDFNRCIEDQKASGVPFEHAKRACSDQRRFSQATSFLGFDSDPINSAGLWLNDRLSATEDAVSGRKSFTKSLEERESAGAAATNLANYQVSTRTNAQNAVVVDGQMDALLQDPGNFDADGAMTDSAAAQLSALRKQRDTARAEAVVSANNAAASRDLYALATINGCSGEPCVTARRVFAGGDPADIAALQQERIKYNQDIKAYEATPPPRDPAAAPRFSQQLKDSGAFTTKTTPEQASLAQQLRDNANGALSSAGDIWDSRGDVPVLGPFLDAGGDFLANYCGEIFSMPQIRVGLEVGNYSFAWTFQKVRHHAMELSWDIDNGLTNLWDLRRKCDRTFDDSLVSVLAIVYSVSQRPWINHRAVRSGLYQSSLNDNIKNHSLAFCNATTVLKLARLSYRYTKQDNIPYMSEDAKRALSGLVLSGGFQGNGDVKPVGLKEAVDALANAAVAVYLLDVATDDSVIRRVEEIKKKIDAAYAGDATQAASKKAEVDKIQKDMINSVASYIDSVVPVLIAINGSNIDTDVQCVEGAPRNASTPGMNVTVPLNDEALIK